MEIVGKIKYIGPDNQVSAAFKKRELAVSTDEQYSQTILIEFTQDKCEYLDDYKQGEDVVVQINLRGREWVNPQGETKYFNSIQGWQIKRRQVQGPAPAQQPPAQNFTPQSTSEDEPDDLPF